MLEKPQSILRSDFKSAKWDEIVEGRDFKPSDIPILTLLCSWYEVVDTCIQDLDIGDGMQVAYSNNLGDIKALPQIATMKQASAEIRAINKQLGINDETQAEQPKQKDAKLYVIQANRQSKANGKRRTKTAI